MPHQDTAWARSESRTQGRTGLGCVRRYPWGNRPKPVEWGAGAGLRPAPTKTLGVSSRGVGHVDHAASGVYPYRLWPAV